MTVSIKVATATDTFGTAVNSAQFKTTAGAGRLCFDAEGWRPA
jgi:hypothetical protein